MNQDNTLTPDWKLQIKESFSEIFQQALNYSPQVIGAIALMLGGVIIAFILKVVTSRILQGVNSFLARLPKARETNRIHIRSSYTKIFSNLVLWAVLALFFAASANLLGWTLITEWFDSIVAFLPNLISGLLIVFAGILIGNFVKSGVAIAAERSSLGKAEMLGWMAQATVIFSFAVIGTEQIGLDLHFLTEVFVVVIGILLAGAALAFGLGAKSLVENIIGIQRIRKHCSIGERLKLDQIEGEILEFTQTSLIIASPTGRTIIPAKLFQEKISEIKTNHETNDSEFSQPKAQGESND